MKEAVKQVKAEVDELRGHREENQQLVQQQKEDIINSILDLRIRISDQLDKLERTARGELNTKYGQQFYIRFFNYQVNQINNN